MQYTRAMRVLTSPPIAWRLAASVLWIVSIVCLFRAVTGAANAEGWSTLAPLSDANRVESQHLSEIADRWAAVGWLLQFATAAVLSFGIKSPRVVRRIFVSLGVLIAIDGATLLLMAVIIHHEIGSVPASPPRFLGCLATAPASARRESHKSQALQDPAALPSRLP
jgi:hypothetical protein